jgi:hypothetical protein
MSRIALALACALYCLLLTVPARAATISIVSMHYSSGHPVPHFHYEGSTLDGDVKTLRDMYETFVPCRLDCIGPDGGATAVLTLNGIGGSYYEGLLLADFLRENHIATVVERGMRCYSACAFGFLGGSGWSSQEGIGTYVDRMVEPGSVLGFHAPYADEDAFLSAIYQRGAMGAQGQTRDSLALMVKELVKWNVDPEVLFKMVGMGPDETYDLRTADDLYLARVALPPTPTSAWITDLPSAVRNVCARLLAVDERASPIEMIDRFLSGWTPQIGSTALLGPISGYTLGDRPLDIGNCAITDKSAATDGEYEIALYFTPGIDGTNAPGTSFFNRQNGWSSAGTGGNPLKRILQKGALNHYFLPLGVDLDSLDLPGEVAIDRNRYNLRLPPLLPAMDEQLGVDATTPTSRVSHIGNVWVFERVGTAELYNTALADAGLGRTMAPAIFNGGSFFRQGTYDSTGASFMSLGFIEGDASAVIDIIALNGPGTAATPEQLRTMNAIACAASFLTSSLTCS